MRSTTLLSSLVACRWSGYRRYDRPSIKPTIWLVGTGYLSVSWPIGVHCWSSFAPVVSVVLLMPQGSPGVSEFRNCRVLFLASSRFFHWF